MVRPCEKRSGRARSMQPTHRPSQDRRCLWKPCCLPPPQARTGTSSSGPFSDLHGVSGLTDTDSSRKCVKLTRRTTPATTLFSQQTAGPHHHVLYARLQKFSRLVSRTALRLLSKKPRHRILPRILLLAHQEFPDKGVNLLGLRMIYPMSDIRQQFDC